jgi:protein-disulfide isomerase
MQSMPEATLSVPVTKSDRIECGDLAFVTLVEYGDYQCPYCGQAYGLVKEIQKKKSDHSYERKKTTDTCPQNEKSARHREPDRILD